ncbi:DNA-binding transcriptional MerR regulator [Haloactinospora alba]|uniref:DNA-binding transcriptional MerR regulator n=1 Tax=Haloactinospora alba TaxID=405555 RepID=A0A543NKX9_9ACTN|nr:MerR family DNA-binding protein [Haloactinospora alba]TQN32493.1 DNA-binding transcriptional MerR regulator [Haloactinospora alba]
MKAEQAEELLSVARLAARVGVRPDTVRYYERVGLLPAPPRTSGDHRRYGTAAVDRLRFIRGTQMLGLRLSEIRELLAVRDTGVCPCEPAEDLLRRRLDELDAEMARLADLRWELAGMLDRFGPSGCPDPAPGTWRPPETPSATGEGR